MASHRYELCNTHTVPWCREPHNHAANHYMSTRNLALIQEAPTKIWSRIFNRRSPPRVLATHGIRHVYPIEGEGMMGMHPNYTAVSSVDGKLVIVSNIDRLEDIHGGVGTRKIGPIVVGLHDLCADSPHLKVRPHTGGNVQNMAKCLTQGSLPIPDIAASQWADDTAMFEAADQVRCAIQGFPLRLEGDRTEDIEAPNGLSA